MQPNTNEDTATIEQQLTNALLQPEQTAQQDTPQQVPSTTQQQSNGAVIDLTSAPV